MATPVDTSIRRLRLVGNHPVPSTMAAPEEDPSARQAAAFAALVAEANQSAIADTLDHMNAEQLRSLAIGLATKANAAESAVGEVADVGPNRICAIAVATAAQSFGTTRDAVLSADRHRAVTDARAVAMTAARRVGMTLPAIAAHFGKDHTTVMYAQTKIANNPRLNAVCAQIVDQLEQQYAMPTHKHAGLRRRRGSDAEQSQRFPATGRARLAPRNDTAPPPGGRQSAARQLRRTRQVRSRADVGATLRAGVASPQGQGGVRSLHRSRHDPTARACTPSLGDPVSPRMG